jgi:biotin synthase
MQTQPLEKKRETSGDELRHDWTLDEILALYALPFPELMFRAQQTHRAHFDPTEVQLSQLLSIKTGGCPEDCAYCPQSVKHQTGLQVEKLMQTEEVLGYAREAQAAGASRYCLGAAWRSPTDTQLERVCEMVEGIKGLGMEACVTLGMLTDPQAARLKEAGLDYYNHNLDTAPDSYGDIITTRTVDDRIETLGSVRKAGLNVCAGGIVGMGEGREARAGLLQALANLPKHPESVPINMLVKVQGTPLAQVDDLDPLEFIRTIAVARVMMPRSMVRLSAGREQMTEELQAMAFLAGANSIFFGDKLLTTKNPAANRDMRLLDKLGMKPMAPGCDATVAAPDGEQ